jgi:hypothetical protein
MIWGLVRTFGLQGLSWLLGAWLSPLGRAAIIAVLALGGWVALKTYWISEGRERERAAAVEAMRQAESAADVERMALEAENAEAADRDARELAAAEMEEKRVRDANRTGGDSLVWRADDGWLRSKSAGKGRR